MYVRSYTIVYRHLEVFGLINCLSFSSFYVVTVTYNTILFYSSLHTEILSLYRVVPTTDTVG